MYVHTHIHKHLWVYIDIDHFSMPWCQKSHIFGCHMNPQESRDRVYLSVLLPLFELISGIRPGVPQQCGQLRGLKEQCKV